MSLLLFPPLLKSVAPDPPPGQSLFKMLNVGMFNVLTFNDQPVIFFLAGPE